MKDYNFDNAPYVYWGKSAYVRTLKLEKIYENLIKKVGENDIFFGDAQSLFYDFLEALKNVKLSQWRDSLLNKKYILIDGFHYFEEKKSAIEELTYIFKHTKAIIFLTLNKPVTQCDFGEEMQYILNAGTHKVIDNETCDCVNFYDIQKHWRKSNYTPSAVEVAWLIKQDKSLTLEEKHKAWTEIIATLPDSAFVTDDYPDANVESIHRFLSAYMELENRLLEQFYKKEPNAVYTYQFWSDEDNTWVGGDGALYADFEEAKAEFMDDADLDPAFALFSKRYIGAEDKRIHIRMRPDGAILSVAEDRYICDEQTFKIFYDVFFGIELDFKSKRENAE